MGSSTLSSSTICVPIVFDNGNVALIYLLSLPDEDRYEVYDIVIVPDEVEEFFNH